MGGGIGVRNGVNNLNKLNLKNSCGGGAHSNFLTSSQWRLKGKYKFLTLISRSPPITRDRERTIVKNYHPGKKVKKTQPCPFLFLSASSSSSSSLARGQDIRARDLRERERSSETLSLWVVSKSQLRVRILSPMYSIFWVFLWNRF